MATSAGKPTVLCWDSPAVPLSVLASRVGTEYQIRRASWQSLLADGVQATTPAVILIGFTATDGCEVFTVINRLHSSRPDIPIVIAVARGSEATAIAALRAGVKDYFKWPDDEEALVGAIRCLAPFGASASDATPERSATSRMVASSAIVRRIDEYLTRVAARDVTVLITGETGTGKELVAGLIHERSHRRGHRLVAVNCAAIPETLLESELFGHEPGAFTGAVGSRSGLLQQADRGTLFLDEVGDLGQVAQAKVLRAIEVREIYRVGGKRPIPLDLRIIAATNLDLDRAVDEARFRRDLYFRLSVVRVHLPPLRERPADVAALVNHYLAELNSASGAAVPGINDETLDALQAYPWPGNVRELKNLLEAVFVTPPARSIAMADLPEPFVCRLRELRSMPDADRRRLLDALTTANWNKSQAAGLLNWSRMTVYRKMAKYSLVRQSTQSGPSRLPQTTSRPAGR